MANLSQSMKNFANKIAGVSTVDNEANPASAASAMKRSIATKASQKAAQKPFPFATKQKTFGVPNAT